MQETPAYRLESEFLRQVLHPGVQAAWPERIKTSPGLACVYRVHLTYNGSNPGAATVIVKHILAECDTDPCAADRELQFYRELAPRLDIPLPRLYYAGPDPAGDGRLLVLEDLLRAYRFHRPAYTWTRAELELLLQAYARLHAAGRTALPPAGQRGWLATYLEQNTTPEVVLRMAGDLVQWGCWPPLPALERLLVEAEPLYTTWDHQRLTVLHQDVYPPNLGLPRDRQGEAVIVDWGLAGWGYAELDLAYLFLLPFRNARRLPREAALESYWDRRLALEGVVPEREEREAYQRQADVLLALALIPAAHQVARQPFSPGSEPRAYWEAMFAKLSAALSALAT